MKTFAILGHPVRHSLSPRLHNAVFQELGLDDHEYVFCDTSPDQLERVMKELREGKYEGFSVTIPFKQKVMQYCDELSERAKKVGAVNTMLRVSAAQFSIFNFSRGAGPRQAGQFSNEEGKEFVIYGDNTDYLGFERSLEEAGVLGELSKPNNDEPNERRNRISSTALVLGTGGAARAVVAVLVDHGFEVMVASRDKERKDLKDLKDSKDIQVLGYDELDTEGDYAVIVNTTPVGMEGYKGQGPGANDQKTMTNDQGFSPLTDPKWFKADRVYVDVIYTPRMTKFLQMAQDAGAKIVTGDRMFLWQAVEQASFFAPPPEHLQATKDGLLKWKQMIKEVMEKQLLV